MWEGVWCKEKRINARFLGLCPSINTHRESAPITATLLLLAAMSSRRREKGADVSSSLQVTPPSVLF